VSGAPREASESDYRRADSKKDQALAQEIRKDFPGAAALVSVLKGGVFFLTDLARNIPGEVSFDSLRVELRAEDTFVGASAVDTDLDSSIEGKTVIVVEDNPDTGMTLQYLLSCSAAQPKHLRGGSAGQTGAADRGGTRGYVGIFHSQRVCGRVRAGLRER